MSEQHYTVIFYKTVSGKSPVQEFIDRQDKATRAKFSWLLDLAKLYSPDLMMPYARYLGSGLYEMRLRGASGVRVFYICINLRQEIVLLHAVKKRSQQLKPRELDLARERQRLVVDNYNT